MLIVPIPLTPQQSKEMSTLLPVNSGYTVVLMCLVLYAASTVWQNVILYN